MVSFIDAHQDEYGVESICRQLPIAPSRYYEYKARETDPERLPPRVQHDMALKPEIRRVWDENFQAYGARKVWCQLNREQIPVARCTVEPLMGVPDLQGAVRGKACRTTVPDHAAERPAEAEVESSVGSRGDSYDNALAETIIGLFETEVILQCGPWRNIDAFENETLEWVDWFNQHRLLGPTGNIPPALLEQAYYQQLEESAMAA